jgi:hypothetical protein
MTHRILGFGDGLGDTHANKVSVLQLTSCDSTSTLKLKKEEGEEERNISHGVPFLISRARRRAL